MCDLRINENDMKQEYEDIIQQCMEDLETARVNGRKPPLREFYDAVKELETRARDRYHEGLSSGEITT